MAGKGGIIPEEEKMRIPQDRNRISGRNHRPRHHTHGSCEGQSHNGLADTNKSQGSASLSQPNELLSMIHIELLGSVAGTDYPT